MKKLDNYRNVWDHFGLTLSFLFTVSEINSFEFSFVEWTITVSRIENWVHSWRKMNIKVAHFSWKSTLIAPSQCVSQDWSGASLFCHLGVKLCAVATTL